MTILEDLSFLFVFFLIGTNFVFYIRSDSEVYDDTRNTISEKQWRQQRAGSHLLNLDSDDDENQS